MSKKRPLLLLIQLALFFAFLTYSVIATIQVHNERFAEFILRREKHVSFYLRLGQTLMQTNQVEELRKNLEEARENNYVDFFMVQYKGEALFWGAPEGTRPDDLIVAEDHLDVPIINEFTSYMSVPLADGSILTIGISKPLSRYIEETFRENWGVLLQDIIVPSVLALWIFAFYLRDIMQVLKVFRVHSSDRKRDYRKIKTRSIESEVFIQGLAGYEQTVDALILQNQTLGNQVLPALKKEILSGKKPPYDFYCTMVRTDINNFSHIFNTHDVTKFMKVINTFFEEVSHIVSRYNGLIHEFVGDEVIFYFKDEDHANSFQIALSAIRDINQVAMRLHGQTLQKDGYPFTVKSSLSHGQIRFGALVNGYSLAGSILIETVRILAHIHEKDGNIVYFDESYLDRVESFCHVSEATRVQLKGFSGQRKLFSYNGQKSVAEILDGLSDRTVDLLTYYRSDDDISEILRHLHRYQSTLSQEVLFKAFQVLRSIQVTKSDGHIAVTLLDWLDDLADSPSARDPKKSYRLLSAASMLIVNLVPRTEYNHDLEKRLARLLRLKDKRVVANLVEVLTHFKSGGDPEFFEKLLEHENNRIAANALVHHGTQDLTPDVIKRLRHMLASKSPAFIASGLYAVGEIAQHHRASDIVYFSSQVDFLRLVQMIPRFVKHDDAMVRRQAFIAARKSEDKAILDEVWRLVASDNSGRLLQEAEEFLKTAVVVTDAVALKRVA